MLQLVECPRDALQGLHHIVPTELKIQYLNLLLEAGFHTLDAGSFVSPQAVPQMADSAEVFEALNAGSGKTRLLAIVANRRGAEQAIQQPKVQYLGYPFSVSDTFQRNNTRRGMEESVALVAEMQALCAANGRELVVYLSMAFGNPYGDAWNPGIVEQWAGKMAEMGVGIISLADTVGKARSEDIQALFETLIPRYPHIVWGAHFHSHPAKRVEKLRAAWDSGCRRFDTALMGYGGCPFAQDDLVGNIATESMLAFCESMGIQTGIDADALAKAAALAPALFEAPKASEA